MSDMPQTANNSATTLYVPDWASRLAKLERILNAVKAYPYIPQGLAKKIEEMENEP